MSLFPQISMQSVTHASSLLSSRGTHTVLSAGGGTGADQERKATTVSDLEELFIQLFSKVRSNDPEIFYVRITALVRSLF